MSSPPSERARVRRLPARADYGRETVQAILREGLVAHVGVVDDGAPVVIPMVYGVDDDYLYLHGSRRSRLLTRLARGADVCIEVSLLDALVVARSQFHHSLNYRSVVVHGRGEEVVDVDGRRAALRTVVEHVIAGQAGYAREASEGELGATRVVRVCLGEASAKVRTGPPIDDDEDLPLPVWAGLIPIERRFGSAQDAPDLGPAREAPVWITEYRR